MTAKELIIDLARTYTYLTIKDLEHLPAGKEDESCGGDSRSGINIGAECVAFTKLGTDLLKTGESGFTPEGFGAYLNRLKDKNEIIRELNDATEYFVQYLESVDDASLDEAFTAPWGQPMTRGKFAAIIAGHTHYHDGQLNYIHTLHGDKQMYWM